MTVTEKLERLTKFSNKRAVSVAAGRNAQFLTMLFKRKGGAGGDDLTIETVVALARVLGVDPGWLIDPSRGWPPVHVESAEELAPNRSHAA